MVPVKWNEQEKSWYVCQSTDSQWYSYTETDKKWANVMLRDGLIVDGITNAEIASLAEMVGKKVTSVGSMFVYVPRYSYKIAYKDTSGNVIGYSDSDGITDINGNIVTGTKKQGTVEVKGTVDGKTIEKYVLHPAFQKFATDELTMKNGGWKEEIQGIWMAKFETSSVQGASSIPSNDNVTTKTIQVKPSVENWRYIQVSNIFTNCQNYNKTLNSHMMKNSEWGCAAYLAISRYGTNTRIAVNQNYPYTGGGASKTAYITYTGQSTTGNVYGIYDMSGGTPEYVASYVNNGYVDLITYAGNLANSSAHLKQVYSKGSSDDREPNYQANKGYYGDAVYETSTNGDVETSWHGNSSVFPYTEQMFFIRGGTSITVEKMVYFRFIAV